MAKAREAHARRPTQATRAKSLADSANPGAEAGLRRELAELRQLVADLKKSPKFGAQEAGGISTASGAPPSRGGRQADGAENEKHQDVQREIDKLVRE
eukprot:5313371-Lingulodinium_polyedra.AAC.1